jgi:multiple sugar transport system substrate-binding protein
MQFVANPKLTPAVWRLQDFLPATLAAETGRDGKLYGIPYVVKPC